MLLSSAGAVGQAKLLSPWDGKPVAATDAAYDCPEFPHLEADLTTDGFYQLGDPTHSIIDPVRQAAYEKTAGPVKKVGAEVVRAADAYRTTGSKRAAACVETEILTLVKERSLTGRMSSDQAYYVQGWIVGAIAIAHLKVRETGLIKGDDAVAFAAWMHAVGQQTISFYGKHNKDGANNHFYWAGVQLAASGIAGNNDSDFKWGIGTYRTGVASILPDGTLPKEMSRGKRALHYHLYALAPLVLLAEFGEANHMDLYAENGGAIHRLVKVCLAGVMHPEIFEKATGVKQEVSKVLTGDQIGWAPPYERRFPNAYLAELIAKAPSLSVFYLGGLPPA